MTDLTVNIGRDAPATHDESASTPAGDTPARDDRGRFGPGNRFSRGRPKSATTDALRRKADPDEVADVILDIMRDPRAPVRERVRCAELVLHTLDGKPVQRSITIRAASAILPPGFDEMTLESRVRILDEIRERAVEGELPPGDNE